MNEAKEEGPPNNEGGILAQPGGKRIDTGGGAFFEGDVTATGDVIGRDKIILEAGAIIQRARSAVEEALKAEEAESRRLAEGVESYARGLIAAVTTQGVRGPYRGLEAYRMADAGIFFGRSKAISLLMERLDRRRLTAFQAESGAGKSSLISAGIAPRLLARGDLPVIVRPYDKAPGLKIKEEFLTDLSRTPVLDAAPLRDFLHRVTDTLGEGRKLWIVLDQFEEFFTLITDAEQREAFVEELAQCLEDQTLDVRWVLAVRSDFFGDVGTFYPRIRYPYENEYRLNRLTEDEARQVIVEQAARAGLTYEDELVDLLLSDLRQDDGTIDPPQIQLVCLALYNAYREQTDSPSRATEVITVALYQREGGVEGILGHHLQYVLRKTLPSAEERDLALRTLTALVSAEQRRQRRTRSDLARRLATGIVAAQSLEEVLRKLVDNRLVNVEKADADDEAVYELAHDYLLKEIELDPDAQEQKAAEELLEREVLTYERYGELLSATKYEFINAQRDFLIIDEIAAGLLRRSEEAIERAKREEEEARHRELKQAQDLLDERTKSATRLKRFLAALGAITLIALVLLGIAIKATQHANIETTRAEAANEELRFQLGSLLGQVASNIRASRPQDALLLALEGLHLQSEAQGRYTGHVETSLRDALAAIESTPLVGPEFNVASVAFSPDQPLLATGGGDGAIRFWPTDGSEADQVPLQANSKTIRALAFDAGGRWLASAGDDGVVRLWDMDDRAGDPIRLPGGDAAVTAVLFEPAGELLAAGDADGWVRIWNVEDARARDTTIGDPIVLYRSIKLYDDISSLAFGPGAGRLAIIDRTGTGSVWNFDLEDREHPMPQPSIRKLALASSSGYRLITGSIDGYVRESIWSDRLRIGFERHVSGLPVRALDVSDDGDILVVADDGGFVHVVAWGESPRPVLSHRAQDRSITDVDLSPDGDLMAVLGVDGAVRLTDLDSHGPEPLAFRHGLHPVEGLSFSDDGQRVAGVDAIATLWSWHVDGSAPITSSLASPNEALYEVAVSPDGRRLAVGLPESGGVIGNPADPDAEPWALPNYPQKVHRYAFSSDSHWLAAANVQGALRLWNVESAPREPAVLPDRGEPVVALAVASGGRWLASAHDSGTIHLWDATLPALDRDPVLPGGDITALAFSADGRWLMAGNLHGRGGLWKVEVPEVDRLDLKGHASSIARAIFSPDNRWLVTADSTGTVLLWDLGKVEGGAESIDLTGHRNEILDAAFGPHGRWLATADAGGAVRLWDLDRVQPGDFDYADPVELRGHRESVTALAFSADGRRLATAGTDGTVRIWRTSLDEVISVACNITGRNLGWAEWDLYLPNEQYRTTCPQWPAHPTFVGHRVKGALAGLREENPDLALALLDEAVALAPNSAGAVTWRGDALFDLGRKEEAFADFTRAVELQPMNGVVNKNLCWAGGCMGRLDDVIDACDVGVRESSNAEVGLALDARAMVLGLSGEYARASDDLRAYISWSEENGLNDDVREERNEWIRNLEDEQNPFDKKVLDKRCGPARTRVLATEEDE